MLHDVGGESIGNGIKSSSAQRYERILIQPLNRNKEGVERQKQIIGPGMIQVLGLSHKREKKSDFRLAWFMFHNIYRMYSDIKK